MLPLLRLAADKDWLMKEVIARLSDDFELTQDERQQSIQTGGTVMSSRTHWAKTYLKQAGLIEQPARAVVRITKRGQDVLAQKPAKLDVAFLQKFPEFVAFYKSSKPAGSAVSSAQSDVPEILPALASSTPEEQISAASQALEEALRDALLARILEGSPAFFEKLIVDLLLAMGYGGSRSDAGQRLGGSGDGGVDGVIREDQLGLDRVYVQAKRYKPANSVGSETVQAFIGALVGRGAQKGVLITTSTFTKQAVSAASQAGGLRIVLIDGSELTRLSARFGVGVRTARTIEIKRIDTDYFDADDEG